MAYRTASSGAAGSVTIAACRTPFWNVTLEQALALGSARKPKRPTVGSDEDVEFPARAHRLNSRDVDAWKRGADHRSRSFNAELSIRFPWMVAH